MEAYLVHICVLAAIYVIMAMGFNLVVGYAGQMNLGYVGLVGVGAYTSAILVRSHDVPFVVGVAAAMALSAAVAGLLALPTRRIRGDYFGLVTLGFHFLAGAIFVNWNTMTRGTLGLPGIPRPEGFTANTSYVALAVIAAVVVYMFLSRLVRSPFGRALEAVRDDEEVAEALGKPVFKLKMLAMIISGGIAGLAGALLAHYVQFISPSSFFLDMLVWCIAAVIIGGLASMEGAVVGMVLLFAVSEPLRFLDLPSDLLGALRLMMFMGALIAMVLMRPKGIMGRAQLEV